MSSDIICRKCGRHHSVQEYQDSKFCRSCGTFLFLPKPKIKVSTPSLRILPKKKKPMKIELREHPKTNRAKVDKNIAYFLGLFQARGKLEERSLIIRIPCKSTNAPNHKDFLVDYIIPRMEKVTGEKIEIRRDLWTDYSFIISIKSEFFLKLLATLELQQGEVCRVAGIPHEIFNANNEIKRAFVRGVGDCSGEIDRYINGRPRVVLRFLNENTKIIEDIVELLFRLSVEIFDVNLSPPSIHRPELSNNIEELRDNLELRYGVNVTGRQEKIGRDNMIRMWAEEYHKQIGFNHPLRKRKLQKYLNIYGG